MAIATHKGPEPIEVLYMPIAQEHEDNIRFRADVEKWLGVPIQSAYSKKYPSMDIFDVFEREGYIAGISGARCTLTLKREVGRVYRHDEDTHVFGYTIGEEKRIADFEVNNPTLRLLWILRDLGITKQDCYRVIEDAGIDLPVMYKLGYNNNNCIGCVKGGCGYWNKIRVDFPDHFARMAGFTRRKGVRLLKVKGERIFLDELPPGVGNYAFEGDISCGPQCALPDPELADLSKP